MVTHISETPKHTLSLGEQLGRTLTAGDVVGLVGDLGAGKTQFVKGIVRGLGIHSRIHSPTFTLVNEYSSDTIRCYHLDLYRLENSSQIISAGLEQYVLDGDAIVVIEWFDRWSADLPQPHRGICVTIQTIAENVRQLSYESFSA
jgi:tRNA threonylcarbamoyladenosine biosynthesis protein TsaE